MVRVLVVEDDPGIRAALLRSLTSAGHAVSSQPTGMAGLTEAVDERPDVVVLDLGLPDVDGLTVLSMLRAVSQVPVVVATARDDEREIVKALDLGADDYLVKPFGGDQLEARIRAVLRRAGHDAPPAPIVVGALVVTPTSREVTLDGIPIELSRKEFDLPVDVHLSWLRRKLGETAADPVYLHSVRGVGVRLVDPSAGPAGPVA